MRKLMLTATLASLWACGDSSSTDPSDVGTSSVSTGSSSSSLPVGCAPGNGKTIELTGPTGGVIDVSQGDTVTITWRATVADYSGFVPKLRLDSATSALFVPLIDTSMLFDIADGSDQCFAYDWVVDTMVAPTGTYPTAVIRVQDYSLQGADYRDQSAAIQLTISP